MIRGGPLHFALNLLACLALLLGGAAPSLSTLFVANEEAEVGQKEERSERSEERTTDLLEGRLTRKHEPPRASRTLRPLPDASHLHRAALNRAPAPDVYTRPRRCLVGPVRADARTTPPPPSNRRGSIRDVEDMRCDRP